MQINKIKTLLIDDEPDSIDVLKIMLSEKCPEVEIVGQASTANEAIEKIQILKPDLLFLDIEMPGKDGFEVLKTFEHATFKVIIITEYEQYALQAIEASAIDFLLKPVDMDEMKVAVNKVKNTLNMNDVRLNHFNSIVHKENKAIDRIVIPTTKGFHTIPFNKIESIEAQSGNYCLFKLSDNSQDLVTKPLNYFEDLLPDAQFFRIHRSHMVNLEKVSEYNSKSGVVTMENRDALEVAVRRRAEFRKGIGK